MIKDLILTFLIILWMFIYALPIILFLIEK